MSALTRAATSYPHHDPAWRGRLIACAVAVIVLWPTMVVSEFKPWILFDWQSLTATGRFLADFLTPAHCHGRPGARTAGRHSRHADH
jgi:hypothetical protein